MDTTTRYGMYAALGLALVVGIVVFFVQRTKNAEQAKIAAYEKEIAGIVEDLEKIDIRDPDGAKRVLDGVEQKKSTWADHARSGQIASLVAGTKAGMTRVEEERRFTTRFAEIEKELLKTDLKTERLKDIRRELDESEARVSEGGAELVARFALAHKKADETYAQKLLEEAKAAAEANPDSLRPALSRYQAAEDELKGMLDRAVFQKNDERRDFYAGLYKQAIGESDSLARTLFNSEGDRLPWINLLVPPQAGNWNPSTAKGFSSQVKDGELVIVGPDVDAGQQAVISIGDREQWRHFQLDVEFVIEQGNIDMCLRLGKGVNQNTLFYPMYTSLEGKLKPSREYAAQISVIGSTLEVLFEGDDIDTPSPLEQPILWTLNRKGAVGLLIAPGARVRFTRFQVRELR